MFKKLLLPLDGSKRAEQALFWAKQYAGPEKAQVVLLQVLHPEYPLEGRPFRAGSPEALHYLQGIERELNFAGIPTRILLRNEPVSRTIVDTARRESCDLIIMSSRGASRVLRWLIGGVTQQVMRLSDVPVLIVRTQETAAVRAKPRRILVPLDGSPLASSVLPWAQGMSRVHRAPLLLLHVRTESGTRSPGAPERSLTKDLTRRAAALRSQGIRATVELERGDAAEEILKTCRRGDLIVMATHGYGGLKRLVLGSVAEKVIHQASVPVLVCKKPATMGRLPQDLAELELFGTS